MTARYFCFLQAAKESKEGKCKFFSPHVNKLLLEYVFFSFRLCLLPVRVSAGMCVCPAVSEREKEEGERDQEREEERKKGLGRERESVCMCVCVRVCVCMQQHKFSGIISLSTTRSLCLWDSFVIPTPTAQLN